MPSHGSTKNTNKKTTEEEPAGIQTEQIRAAIATGSLRRKTSSSNSSLSGTASSSAPRTPEKHYYGRPMHVPMHQSAQYDGNADSPGREHRDPRTSAVIVHPKNFDLGMYESTITRGVDMQVRPPERPGYSTLGLQQRIGLNFFPVQKFDPSRKIYQFDVQINNGTEKRVVVHKVWKSKPVQQALGTGWIFDGNRLAWRVMPIDRDIRVEVDLDVEQGRPPREDKPNKFRVAIRQTNSIRFDCLEAYLNRKADFDNSVLEAVNFLDHLLRENPSQRLTSIKRNFFLKGEKRFDLGRGVEAFKGVYQSLRIMNSPTGAQLSVNVDVANGTFYNADGLMQVALKIAGSRDYAALTADLKERNYIRNDLRKKLRKVYVVTNHRGSEKVDEYVIDDFSHKNAHEEKFEYFDKASGQKKTISVYEWFQEKYRVRLQFPTLPLIRMTKNKGKTALPMEVLKVKENQRYAFKLDDKQTSNMIKFAVEPPTARWEAIKHGLRMLDWANDPVHRQFGLKISAQNVTVPCRVLPAPKVAFGGGVTASPGTSGRWDLKGKRFYKPNPAPLKSWSVCMISGRRGGKPDKAILEHFIREFCKIYIVHGGRIENKNPAMTLQVGFDVGAMVTAAWNVAGNQAQLRPQILVFILPDTDANTYGRIKRSCECRYGVPSQCMQYAQVARCQPQYISNVCMKFNAKLGGLTCRALGATTSGELGVFKVPTVVMGADVSHSSPGTPYASMAALTMSQDKLGCKYTALCQTNGYRMEMISKGNIEEMMKPQLESWMMTANNGKLPSRIVYLRDGVSEGQYYHVLQQEVHDMKSVVQAMAPGSNVPFVVIVGVKRHHVRFFPEPGKGDRTGNALPGTLVEHGATHPTENDFYLCSHAAIKGVARPVHYYVLLNEAGMSQNEIHTMLYEHSYQFQRATTPVSQHPAIYYAHIASNRAAPHDPTWGGSADGNQGNQNPSGSPPGSQAGRSTGSDSRGKSSGTVDTSRLMPMQGTISKEMWYI